MRVSLPAGRWAASGRGYPKHPRSCMLHGPAERTELPAFGEMRVDKIGTQITSHSARSPAYGLSDAARISFAHRHLRAHRRRKLQPNRSGRRGTLQPPLIACMAHSTWGNCPEPAAGVPFGAPLVPETWPYLLGSSPAQRMCSPLSGGALAGIAAGLDSSGSARTARGNRNDLSWLAQRFPHALALPTRNEAGP